MADTSQLESLEFFKAFNADQLPSVAALATTVDAQPGSLLTEQGRVGQEAFVVVSGEAEVCVAGEPVASVGPGSLIGEMALIDLRPRSATVRAVTPMTLLRFGSHEFRKLLASMPEAEAKMLARRSAETREHNLAEED